MSRAAPEGRGSPTEEGRGSPTEDGRGSPTEEGRGSPTEEGRGSPTEDEDCVFCLISNGQDKDAEVVRENEELVCFRDIVPAAPHHYLVIPRQHVVSCRWLTQDQLPLGGWTRDSTDFTQPLLFCNQLTVKSPCLSNS
ncbi:hypothetical protein NHX12_026502 [Muraenolepis orangiensis]|uniref:HIT domain-containing protein n=1 Tax=Muraenolepis orangiensis TaxID=630683 RepID=A0A9Q0INB0_9TELE|nr:hypothetical protein NHX12_026502 [Muraenolepis orangiensis]